MSSFYKMDPAAWDYGTADLGLEEEAAYLRIVNAIHKHDGPVPNIDRVLAGMFRCSTRKARALVEALIAAGKITIEDGKIWDKRARSDLVHRQFVSNSSAERGAKGGRTRGENAAKPLKENGPPQAVASPRIEENRIEEKRIEEREVETIVSTARKRATSLPPDWIPSDRNIADAEARGFSQQEIEHEGLRFRDHHLARGTCFKCWDAGWRTWLGNARRFGGSVARSSPAERGGPGGSIASIAAWRRTSGKV